MDSSGKGVSGCEYRGDGLLGCSSLGNFTPLPSDEVLGMPVGSEHWNGVHSSFSGGWTPLDSVAHNVEVTTSATSSHGLVDNFSYTDKFLAELEHDIPCFGSGTFPDMDSLVILQRCRWIANSGSSASHPTEESGKNEKALTPQCAGNYSQSQEKCKILDDGAMKPSPDGKKRRRACNDLSQSAQLKNMKMENDQWTRQQDEEKQNPEIKPVAKTCSQIVSKEVKDSSSSGDPPKEDYVHVRAKRGQATNSHSLAERVRRERIRERMKFLQDLVPGCDKITGKAVMLDEIINYVLSLQRQVEFLSMKLATVHPESNVEPKQIVHRDIHHSRHESAATLGDPGPSSYPNETLQRALLDTHGQTANSESSPMPNVSSIWQNELQNTSQMEFMSDMALDNSE